MLSVAVPSMTVLTRKSAAPATRLTRITVLRFSSDWWLGPGPGTAASEQPDTCNTQYRYSS